jgi:hypothetical protein
VVSGGAIAQGHRWYHDSTDLGLSTFSWSFGFHVFLPMWKREIRMDYFLIKRSKKKKLVGLGRFPPPSPSGRLNPISGRVRPRSDCVVKERRF